MRELARLIGDELTIDGVAPREVVHVHHVHHHHAPAAPAPVQQERTIAPRLDTVEAVTDALANIVKATRQMTEQEQTEIYRVMHGSLHLIAATIDLDHAPSRRSARK